MGRYVLALCLLLLAIQVKAQPAIAKVELAMHAICEDGKLMRELCSYAPEFKNQLIVFHSLTDVTDAATINFLCHNYSIWITTPGEAFFRDLAHNRYHIANWTETEIDIQFKLVPSPLNGVTISTTQFHITLSKKATGLKLKEYQKLE